MHVGIIVLFILRQPLFELSVGETGISPSVRFFLRQCAGEESLGKINLTTLDGFASMGT